MIYKEFNNIEIVNFPGVSKVGRDTLALASFAGRIAGRSFLDVGTGTGFVAIYLASLGKKTEATDISKTSIKAAVQNAKNSRLNLRLIESDLFKNISGKYDVITFNPPVGNSRSSNITVFIEMIKSILPRSDLLAKIGLVFLGNGRRTLINEFLSTAGNHLSRNGKIVMLLASGDEQLLKEYNYSIHREKDIKIAVIKR